MAGSWIQSCCSLCFFMGWSTMFYNVHSKTACSWMGSLRGIVGLKTTMCVSGKLWMFLIPFLSWLWSLSAFAPLFSVSLQGNWHYFEQKQIVSFSWQIFDVKKDLPLGLILNVSTVKVDKFCEVAELETMKNIILRCTNWHTQFFFGLLSVSPSDLACVSLIYSEWKAFLPKSINLKISTSQSWLLAVLWEWCYASLMR